MKTRVRTVNVVVLDKSQFDDEISVEKITSFVDTKEGHKAASAFFKKTVNAYNKKDYQFELSSSELESIMLEGSFDSMNYYISLDYSN